MTFYIIVHRNAHNAPGGWHSIGPEEGGAKNRSPIESFHAFQTQEAGWYFLLGDSPDTDHERAMRHMWDVVEAQAL